MKTRNYIIAIALSLFVNIGCAYAQTCPNDIIAYWKFEEVGSTILGDFISVHDATSSSILTNVVDGRVGNAKYFDGTRSASVSDHVDFAFPTNSSFSAEFWVKIATAPTSTQVIIGKRDSNGSGAYWFVGLGSDGKIFFEAQASGDVYKEIKSPSSVVTDTWRHIAIVRDENTNGNYLYVDGTLAASLVYNYTGSFISDGDLTLGCYNNTSGIPGYFYKGNLDEVAIFDRALTSTEIAAHKALGDNGIGYCDGYSPTIISTPNVKATVNSVYTYRVRATGLQSNMRYSLLTKPTGMGIDDISGVITWTPSSTADDGFVTVVANNNVAPADTQSYRIFIAEAPDCPQGLLALFRLDEAAGPEYADFYGAHNATAIVSPNATTGIVDGAQSFNAGTKIDIPDNGNEFDWVNQDNWSIEFWMKTSNAATMIMVGRHRAADDFPDYAKWWVGVNGSGEATFSLQDNGVIPKLFEISGGPNLVDDQWHHVIAVREGSIQQNRIYVDGIEAVSVTTNYGNSFKADLPTPVSMGYWKRSGNEYHYVGALDQVAIFNKALTAQEASNFYNLGEPVGHCSPGNFAPVITSTPVTTATQDALYTYLFEVEEVDVSDPITLSAIEMPDWLTFIHSPGQKSGLLSGTPTNSDVALPASVTLRVNDGTVSVDQSFVIAVQNVNDLPVISSIPAESVDEGVLYSYNLIVEDIDPADVITMTAVTLPEWLSFNWTAGTKTASLIGTPTNDDVGANPVSIKISDGTVEIYETYSIYVSPVNDAPIITGQNTLTYDEDESFILTLVDLVVEDEDNSLGELSLSILAGNNYSLSGIVVTPDDNFNGLLIIPVTVSDPESVSAIFNVSVTVNPVNDKPEIVSTPDLMLLIDKLFAYSFEATDADGDILVYSSVTLPDWLTFINSNGILTGTPKGQDRGEHLVILSASDGTESVEQSFILEVSFPEGIEDHLAHRFTIYPSPVTEVLYLEFETLLEDAVLYVFNNIGSLVKSVKIPMSTDKFNIEVSDLNGGSYYCVLRNSHRNQALKFLITK